MHAHLGRAFPSTTTRAVSGSLRRTSQFILDICTQFLRADDLPIPAQCKALKKDASTLITDVARKAADSPQRNATGEKEHDERDCKLKLYSLADCLPGISAAECRACLEDLTSLPGLSSGQMGERKATVWSLICFSRIRKVSYHEMQN